MLKNSRLLCAASYLVARLEWAFEFSRLTVPRLRPQVRIVQVAKNESQFVRGQWICAEDSDYFLYFSREIAAPAIRALPERTHN